MLTVVRAAFFIAKGTGFCWLGSQTAPRAFIVFGRGSLARNTGSVEGVSCIDTRKNWPEDSPSFAATKFPESLSVAHT